MTKLPARFCLSLLLLAGTATGLAQQRDQGNDPLRGGAQEQRAPVDPQSQQRQDPSRGRGQADGARQGRLSPEERQALRRQIDEAGHDIYRTRR